MIFIGITIMLTIFALTFSLPEQFKLTSDMMDFLVEMRWKSGIAITLSILVWYLFIHK